MSTNPRVVHKKRETVTALPLYYHGQLMKKHKTEKDFLKYHAELRGTTLFLYWDNTQETYTEKLDLEQVKSMQLNSPYQKKAPTIFTLRLGTDEVQLKMDNPDEGEEWRCYILTVIKKEIPSKLQLLPGQVLRLQDVLTQEKRRICLMPRPPLPPRPSFLLSALAPLPPLKNRADSGPDVPACFFNVTRQEAEQMLEANPEYGSIILRPSSLANNYALTLRQPTPSGPVMKNYRVTSTKSEFIIELETVEIRPLANNLLRQKHSYVLKGRECITNKSEVKVKVSSLNDVLKYFLEQTEYHLRPYIPSQPYDTRIEVLSAADSSSITKPKPGTLPKAQVAPMLRSNATVLQPPPANPVDNEYVVPCSYSPNDDKVKMAQLDGELREGLVLWRDTTSDVATHEEDVISYENETGKKKETSGRVEWSTL